MPIITHEDERILAKTESDLESELKSLAKEQSKVVKAQRKYADRVSSMNIQRDKVNRTMRDMFKQMQMLAREGKSNVTEQDVNIIKGLINDNDEFIKANTEYLNAIKDLAVQKDYYIEKMEEFAESFGEISDRRETVIKKALDVEKTKNKMVEGSKLQMMDQELKDIQRTFDRSHDVLLKKIEQFDEARKEINDLWLALKNKVTKLS